MAGCRFSTLARLAWVRPQFEHDADQCRAGCLQPSRRMKRSDSYVLVSIPNLLDCHYHARGARYENYFYSIESPGPYDYALNDHEYLHTVINPLVEKLYPG